MVNNDSLPLIISPHKDGTKFSEQKKMWKPRNKGNFISKTKASFLLVKAQY